MNHRLSIAVLSLLLTSVTATVGWAETLATVGGQPVTLAEVEAASADQLRELDRQRHRVIEAGLDATIEARLLRQEAERQNVNVDALVAAEITAKVTPVSEAEIDAFYEGNAARIRQPKDVVAAQIRTYLDQQRTTEARRALLARLRTQHPVVKQFEPLRVEIPSDVEPTRGPSEAPVTLTVFSDFQCPGCKGVAPILDALHEAYPDQLAIAFRQFPLEQIHPQARRAGEASLCAHAQGRFWDMHDALFADQRALDDEAIEQRAQDLGLDGEAFAACLGEGRKNATIDADVRLGLQIGVAGTPSLFVNGRPVVLTQEGTPEAQLSAVIDDELARVRQRAPAS